jgi:two-component system sensor histidine kinase QseC
LWGWTLVALGLTWGVLIAVADYTGRHEADELGDGQMAATATLWLALQQWPTPSAMSTPHPTDAPTTILQLGRYRGYEQAVAIMGWHQGQLVIDSHQLAQVPVPPPSVSSPTPTWAWQTLPDGWHTQLLVLGAQQHQWRVLVRTDSDTQRRVVLVADVGARTALGRDFAEHIARPALIVLPLIALLLAWALHHGLQPFKRLSQQIDALDLTRSRLADAPPHIEFVSTVRALHALMDRLEQQLQQERQFASDIAHELRTPLTALSLQAHAVQHAATASEHTAAAQSVHQLALHAGALLQQLLDFARAQRQQGLAMAQVDLPALVQQVVADHAQAAHDSGHELELVLNLGPTPPPAPAVQPLLLALALRNLVANALTHTPTGTQVRVQVSATSQGWRLTVDDDGQARRMASHDTDTPHPSPPTHAQTKGLGLGLTLARRIAQWHDAEWLSERPPAPYTTRFGLALKTGVAQELNKHPKKE